MKKDFDFDELGKQTPYRTPDGFFESVQQRVLERAAGERRPVWGFRRWAVAGLAAAAAIAVLLMLSPGLWRSATEEPVSQEILAVEAGTTLLPDEAWIEQLSDEELEELIDHSENDVFLDKLTLLTF